MKNITLLIFCLFVFSGMNAQQLVTDHKSDRYDHSFVPGEKISVYVKGKGKGYKGQLLEVQSDKIKITNRYRIERKRGMTADQAWKTDTLLVNIAEISKIGWVLPKKKEGSKKMQRNGAIVMGVGASSVIGGLVLLSNGNSNGTFLLLGGLLGTVAGGVMLSSYSKSVSDEPSVKAVGSSMKLFVK